VAGIDDQQVDGPDKAAGHDRRSQGEDRPTHDVSLRLGDDDTGLRQVDELAEEIRGIERALATIDPTVLIAQGDDAVDIGDTGCSDQVFHADGSYLAGLAVRSLDRSSAEVRPRPAVPSSAASDLTLATR
jgi:hypothetical protein